MTETIRKTMDNLEKNGIKAFFVETKEEVVPLVKTLVPQEAVFQTAEVSALPKRAFLHCLKAVFMIL